MQEIKTKIDKLKSKLSPGHIWTDASTSKYFQEILNLLDEINENIPDKKQPTPDEIKKTGHLDIVNKMLGENKNRK